MCVELFAVHYERVKVYTALVYKGLIVRTIQKSECPHSTQCTVARAPVTTPQGTYHSINMHKMEIYKKSKKLRQGLATCGFATCMLVI